MNPTSQIPQIKKISPSMKEPLPSSKSYLPAFQREKIPIEEVIPASAAEHLQCSICLHLLNQPTTLSCGHSYCLDCLKKNMSSTNKNCPDCRFPLPLLDSLKKCIKLTSIIENLVVKCPSHKYDPEKNCKEELKIKDLEKHWKSCPHMYFRCKCNELIKSSSFLDGEQKCKCLEVKCEYCSELYQERLIKFHSDACIRSGIKCKYCGSRYPIESEQIHQESECFSYCPFKIYGCIENKLSQKMLKTHGIYHREHHDYLLLRSMVDPKIAFSFLLKNGELNGKVPDFGILQQYIT